MHKEAKEIKQQQQQVFDPFPVADTFGAGFDGAGMPLYDHLGGKDAAGFVDYSSVLDVSENLGYGESSSNSSNRNYGGEVGSMLDGEVGSVLDGEVLHWAKAEPAFAEMEYEFSLPCQEQSLLPNFEFNMEHYF